MPTHITPRGGIWVDIEISVKDKRELEKVAEKEDIEPPIYNGRVIGYDL